MKELNSSLNSIKNTHETWGAEAHLFREKWFDFNAIKKLRIPKRYRIAEIDNELRESRTVTESRLMISAKKSGVQTPHIFEIDLEETSITMEYIEGKLVKDVLKEKIQIDEKVNIVSEIGQKVGILHSNDIIHGDLTTSNIMRRNGEIIFIDFGLGKFSLAVEDKAVDILLIKKCFTSTHTEYESEFFMAFQEGYKKTMNQSSSIFRRAAKVEARGRHLKEEQVIDNYLIS